MVSRRAVLGATGVVIAGSSAGCLQQLPFIGGEPIEFEATPASVPSGTLDATGYEEAGVDDVVIERTFEVGGQSQDVVVTNWQAEYDKAVNFGATGLPVDEEQRAAVFTALTTPQVEVLGREFNPVAEMSSAELASMIQDRYDGIGDLEQVGEREHSVAGESTTVGEFETEAELVEPGITLTLALHIAEAVEAGDDLLVAIGGYPRLLQADERDNIFTLMDAVEHGQ